MRDKVQRSEDEIRMAEEIGRLEQIERTQTEAIRGWESKYQDMYVKLTREKQINIAAKFFWGAAGALTSAAFIVAVFLLSYFAITSEPQDGCYVERVDKQVKVFTVNRIVGWGPDEELGYSTDIDEARDIAKKNKCKMNY